MNSNGPDHEPIIGFIRESESFTLLSHISPDGDTLGAALALFHLLKRMGKTAEIVCSNPVPKIYRFMPGSELVRLPEDAAGYPCVISVDCADTPRFGRAIRLFESAEKTAAIDHHITNPRFADVNLVEADASATAEIVFKLYNRLDMPVDETAAVCLYTGIVTDTGNLSYSNTTPNALRIIADFVEKKLVDVSEINRRIYRTVPYEKTRVQGFVMSNIRLECGGEVGIGTLTQAQMMSYGATNEDCEGIVDCVRDIDCVKIGAFIRESADGSFKVSLRSKGIGDVGRIAAKHAGGGHEKAAGYTAREALSTVISDIIREAEEELDRCREAADCHEGNQ